MVKIPDLYNRRRRRRRRKRQSRHHPGPQEPAHKDILFIKLTSMLSGTLSRKVPDLHRRRQGQKPGRTLTKSKIYRRLDF